MNHYTEQNIEEQLDELAAMKPSDESAKRINRNIRSMISNTQPTNNRWLLYYMTSAAAVLIVALCLLQVPELPTIAKNSVRTKIAPALTLAQLNAVFNKGGEKALDEHFDKVYAKRDAQPETITLQEILKEL